MIRSSTTSSAPAGRSCRRPSRPAAAWTAASGNTTGSGSGTRRSSLSPSPSSARGRSPPPSSAAWPREFVTAEGATLDSSEVRGRDDVELDQNGVLLHVLGEYAAWTGDRRLSSSDLWDRIAAIAEYPLRPEFRHEPSGMLSGSREFWERHAAHGIEPGLEMAYQMFVSLGLARAARLARQLGHEQRGGAMGGVRRGPSRSDARASGLCVVRRRAAFIKRRTLDGTVQETIVALPDRACRQACRWHRDGPHLLNPDTCCVLPIVFGVVDPRSPLSRATLVAVESLWNQAWDGGGYGRYHVSSEPDSPGALALCLGLRRPGARRSGRLGARVASPAVAGRNRRRRVRRVVRVQRPAHRAAVPPGRHHPVDVGGTGDLLHPPRARRQA